MKLSSNSTKYSSPGLAACRKVSSYFSLSTWALWWKLTASTSAIVITIHWNGNASTWCRVVAINRLENVPCILNGTCVVPATLYVIGGAHYQCQHWREGHIQECLNFTRVGCHWGSQIILFVVSKAKISHLIETNFPRLMRCIDSRIEWEICLMQSELRINCWACESSKEAFTRKQIGNCNRITSEGSWSFSPWTVPSRRFS